MSNTTFTRKNNWQCKKYHESVIVGIERQNLDTVCDEDIQKVVRVVLANGINWQRKKKYGKESSIGNLQTKMFNELESGNCWHKIDKNNIKRRF